MMQSVNANLKLLVSKHRSDISLKKQEIKRIVEAKYDNKKTKQRVVTYPGG